ncbi:GTPase Era [Nakamurella flavida]|uniref:GTPase Era n=1 Tax=Nakamurella flavida TaxID=363630 RepID=A0A938YPK4_9ACTN|nr:GTPase Era [Nakamurella flavida]MBM9477147.1 GTPase Era [Nakamurella flavida]MDP9780094.1 GTP-binding protein Era [Nakamurella flavida]
MSRDRSPGGTADHHAGFACFVGRPNVGKSTLLNALVGEKIAITSDKPQTTRRAIRGIVTRPDAQLVVVDTPGMHKPRTLLGERLGEVIRGVWSDVDVIGFCVPADEAIGPGDRRIMADLAHDAPRTPVLGIVTKTDKVGPEAIAKQLLALSQVREFADVIPVSAVRGDQVGLLTDLLVAQLPESPRLYPDGEVTDEPVETLIAELVREAALDGVRDELPHSLAVLVSEMMPRERAPGRAPLTDVFATIYVERDSQKSIVLGHKGSRLASVGRRSRVGIEKLLGTQVYLDLHVTVAKEWQRDPKQLRKLGFDG